MAKVTGLGLAEWLRKESEEERACGRPKKAFQLAAWADQVAEHNPWFEKSDPTPAPAWASDIGWQQRCDIAERNWRRCRQWAIAAGAPVEKLGDDPAAPWHEVRDALVRHPTLAECEAAGKGPYNAPGRCYKEGGLPNTPEERERFEAYMRGHCWAAGAYDDKHGCYDNIRARQLYGVWRDRGALPTIFGTTK